MHLARGFLLGTNSLTNAAAIPGYELLHRGGGRCEQAGVLTDSQPPTGRGAATRQSPFALTDGGINPPPATRQSPPAAGEEVAHGTATLVAHVAPKPDMTGGLSALRAKAREAMATKGVVFAPEEGDEEGKEMAMKVMKAMKSMKSMKATKSMKASAKVAAPAKKAMKASAKAMKAMKVMKAMKAMPAMKAALAASPAPAMNRS